MLADWGVGRYEKHIKENVNYYEKNMKNGLLALFIGLVLLSGCESKKDTIHIATKPMSEQFILGEMLALLIEETPICT